ncbi:MAG: hypothetical protein ISS58_01030 [Dehalococcoidales bacterium]|jgi:hypothetical protein|nr:hypothetical protein [Dehalococcoidales bacterium]
MEESEQKSAEQLWKELLDIVERQLEVNTQLKDVIGSVTGASSSKKEAILTDEVANRVQDLFIEFEALLAEERAVFHSLFKTEG